VIARQLESPGVGNERNPPPLESTPRGATFRRGTQTNVEEGLPV
jgi:hypothetical protein